MSVSNGPRLGVMISAATGDNFDVDFRKFLRAFEALVMCSVTSKTLTAPPGSPANGDRYIVATGGTGAWSGHDNALAVWSTDNPAAPSGEWEFYPALIGFVAFNVADTTYYRYTGSAWAPLSASSFTALSDVPASYSGSGGFEVEVNAGATALVFNAKPFDISLFAPGLPTAGATILRFVFTRAVTLPISLTGSKAGCGSASTGAKAFTLNKNGSSIGTVNIAGSATTATFTFSAGVSFAAGDILSIVAPTPQDATLADFFVTLLGTRT
jgi:hypothetical protein